MARPLWGSACVDVRAALPRVRGVNTAAGHAPTRSAGRAAAGVQIKAFRRCRRVSGPGVGGWGQSPKDTRAPPRPRQPRQPRPGPFRRNPRAGPARPVRLWARLPARSALGGGDGERPDIRGVNEAVVSEPSEAVSFPACDEEWP